MVDAPTRRTEALSGRRRNPAPEREMTRGEVQKTSRSEVSPEKSDENPPMYASLYPAYANIWITEGLWAEPRSPIGQEKRGREPPLIQIFAYTVMVFP